MRLSELLYVGTVWVVLELKFLVDSGVRSPKCGVRGNMKESTCNGS